MFEINEAVVLAAAVLVSAVLATELFGYVQEWQFFRGISFTS